MSENQLVYRISRYRNAEHDHNITFDVSDEPTQTLLARCHLNGRAAQSTLEIETTDGNRWTSTPNRRVMPTEWELAENGRLAYRLNAKVAGKLLNPMYRTSLSVRTADDRELFVVADPRSNLPDRVLGTGPADWELRSGDRALGKMIVLPRGNVQGSGIVAKVRRFFAGYDYGLASFGSEPVLPPAAALALVAIHLELTDASSH